MLRRTESSNQQDKENTGNLDSTKIELTYKINVKKQALKILENSAKQYQLIH